MIIVADANSPRGFRERSRRIPHVLNGIERPVVSPPLSSDLLLVMTVSESNCSRENERENIFEAKASLCLQ